MKKPPLVILLPLQLPQELVSFLDGYLVKTDVSNLLFSLSFEVEGYFVALEVLNIDKDKRDDARKLRVPTQFVLASAGIGNSEAQKYGFV